ncbi:MAG TPA: hypothetical protein VIH99_14295 [Bdellovibrionota bacterium]|jgi:hypothetical protein
MRIRKRYMWVPLMAAVGLVVALYLIFRGQQMSTVPTTMDAPPVTTPESSPPPAPEPHSEFQRDSTRAVSAANARPALGGSKLSDSEVSKVRSDMKISLAAIYGAQKSFYSEYHRYSTDLRQIGYSPESPQKLSFKTGFLAPFYPQNLNKTEDPRFRSFDDYVESDRSTPDQGIHYANGAESLDLSSAQHFCKQGCTADAEHFEVITAANLDNDPDLDVWILSETKTIVHVFDDLK